jgi:SAM-dependent methyltransferase
MDLSFIPESVRKANQGCASSLFESDHLDVEGCVIIDLGCGAGLDVFLAAQAVGAGGRVIGIDMTPEMLAIAKNAAPQVADNLGYANTEFHLAQIENMPLADHTADIIISNCVVNLAQAKSDVFAELFRVLKPGGMFVISDVFTFAPIPYYIQNDATLISQCIGGAMEYEEFFQLATQAGFGGVHALGGGRYMSVDGYDFVSLTVSGTKPDDQAISGDCFALLTGPMSRAVTATGRSLLRGKPQRVSSEEAQILQSSACQPYIQVSTDERSLSENEIRKILPESGPCKYTGKFAVHTGPFLEMQDDDSHIYSAGEPLEICDKTAAVLADDLYKPLFTMLDKAGNRTVSANETTCGDSCCC